MTADHFTELRRIASLATLTPGEAITADLYEEHLAAVKAAPAHLKAAIDHAIEADAKAAYATRRCREWFEIATKLRATANTYELRARANEGRKAQNDRLRELFLAERRKRQARALRDHIEEEAK